MIQIVEDKPKHNNHSDTQNASPEIRSVDEILLKQEELIKRCQEIVDGCKAEIRDIENTWYAGIHYLLWYEYPLWWKTAREDIQHR